MNKEKQGIYANQVSFINGVRSYLDGVFCPKSKLFILRTTPSVWQYCGIGNKDIVLPCSVVDKAVLKHHMNKEEISTTLMEVFEPLYLFKTDKEKSEFKGNGFLIISNVVLEDDKLGGIGLHPDEQIKNDLIKSRENGHIIATIHQRKTVAQNGISVLKMYADKNLLLYLDDIKLKEIKQSEICWLLPGTIPAHNTQALSLQTTNSLSWSNNKILKKSDFVKYSKIFDENNTIELKLKEYAERTKDYRCFNKKIIKKPYIVLVCNFNKEDISNVEIWDKDRLHYVKQNALCVEYRFNKDLNRYFYRTSSAVLQIYKGDER